MSFDSELFFKVLACAYKHGVLDKVMHMQGRSMQLVIEETGFNMVDLINRMDETTEETLYKLDRLLEKSQIMLRIATSGILMKAVSRMLDLQVVKNFVIQFTKNAILKTMTDKQIASGENKLSCWQDCSLAKEG